MVELNIRRLSSDSRVRPPKEARLRLNQRGRAYMWLLRVCEKPVCVGRTLKPAGIPRWVAEQLAAFPRDDLREACRRSRILTRSTCVRGVATNVPTSYWPRRTCGTLQASQASASVPDRECEPVNARRGPRRNVSR